MRNKTFKRVMAYIYMPLLFIIAGYLLMYFIFAPILSQIPINLFIADNTDNDSGNINSIFEGPDESLIIVDDPEDTEDPEDPDVPKKTYIKESDVVIPGYETHYAIIEISNVGLKDDLYYGDSSAVLKKGAGQFMGSFIPGYGRPLLIGGHNNGEFNKLKNVKAGDIIKITTNYGIYEYEIKETKILKATDKSAYDLAKREEECILYTCYPFDMLGLTENRFFVYADKVSGPDIILNG